MVILINYIIEHIGIICILSLIIGFNVMLYHMCYDIDKYREKRIEEILNTDAEIVNII